MNWAVVMTGGKGTRFWPESRNRHPKPFLKLVGRKSLLEETVERLTPFFPPSRILIVLQDSLVGEARRLFPRIPKDNFLGEPVQRNTAPCCVYAASRIHRRDPQAKLIFLPADQFIHPKSLYLKTLQTAFKTVDEKPVLLGMRPDSPHTGYGYLETAKKSKRINGISCFRVKRFHEKPALAEAKRFLKQGNFFWNGGTFIWRVESFKKAVQKYAPKIYSAWNLSRPVFRRRYKKLPSISIDYAVMEKMKDVHCLLVPFKWKDLGSWAGVAEFWFRDSHGNRTRGEVLLVKSRGNIVKSDKRLVALVGAEDLVVVDTEDALLVSPRSKVQEIREVVKELEKKRARQYL